MARTEATEGHDVHTDAEELLEVLDQPDLIYEGCLGVELDQEVDVAIEPSLSPGDRPENPNPRCTAPPGRGQDLGSPSLEVLEGGDTRAHAPSVPGSTSLELEQ
jgi:hypothetical protein